MTCKSLLASIILLQIGGYIDLHDCLNKNLADLPVKSLLQRSAIPSSFASKILPLVVAWSH